MEKKLKAVIIGQGRSGKNIHGRFLLSELNTHFEIYGVVDRDPVLRKKAAEIYPGAKIFSDYRELFAVKDSVDLCVNAAYSDEHYPVTKDLLEHGFNVLTEKPFARTWLECMILAETAERSGAVLAVFHNTQTAPFYTDAVEKIKSGILGEPLQISIRYSGFARRWDWQTLQKKVAGSTYNTGPHPIAMGLGFLGFDGNARVAYSRLGRALTSGDGDDYSKIILEAPGGPVVDIEISSADAYAPPYTLKVQGTRGTLASTPSEYGLKYIIDGENPPRPVVEQSLRDGEGMPVYCHEKLKFHEESGEYSGNAMDVGAAGMYSDVYYAITEGRPLRVDCGMAAEVVRVIETVHAQNPLSVKFV